MIHSARKHPPVCFIQYCCKRLVLMLRLRRVGSAAAQVAALQVSLLQQQTQRNACAPLTLICLPSVDVLVYLQVPVDVILHPLFTPCPYLALCSIDSTTYPATNKLTHLQITSTTLNCMASGLLLRAISNARCIVGSQSQAAK